MLWTVLALGAMLGLMLLGLPIAFSMLLVGATGLTWLIGWPSTFALVSQVMLDTGRSYELSVVPLFILMGALIHRCGISDELYSASRAWLGHLRGGLAMATILACGAFSAVSGSSIATAATMSKVAMPPMRKYGYADSLAAGSVAAGGTLGVLIPPSVIMIIYGLITETSIAQLFIAGIIPGLITIAGYLLAIIVVTAINPHLGPAAERDSTVQRWRSLRSVWPILALFAIVIGGIYLGVFTPTESAGIGAAGAFLFAYARGSITLHGFVDVMAEAGRITAMLFVVLIGALVFSALINIAGFPDLLSGFVRGLGLTPLEIIVTIVGIYLIIGMFLETLSMVLLTVPIFFPIVQELGYSPVWFGILVVVVVEISLITPPIGMNIFVLRSVITDIRSRDLYLGLLPFYVMDILRLLLFLLVPSVVLVLPNLMSR